MATIAKYCKIIFSENDLKFIKDNFKSMTNKQIADALGLKITKVREMAYSMGLKRMELEYWTVEQIDFLKANYKEMGDVEMAELFQVKFPKDKVWSKRHIAKKRGYLNLTRSKLDFEKIHQRNKINGRLAVANKKRWQATGSKAVGTIVIWKNYNLNRALIKTEKGYVDYCRWIWQNAFGAIEKGYCIAKKEGCPEIPTLEFLEIITREENARRNKLKNSMLPEDLKEIIKIKNVLTKKIKKNDTATPK